MILLYEAKFKTNNNISSKLTNSFLSLNILSYRNGLFTATDNVMEKPYYKSNVSFSQIPIGYRTVYTERNKTKVTDTTDNLHRQQLYMCVKNRLAGKSLIIRRSCMESDFG